MTTFMIVIATAEPYGAYHLKPLEAVLVKYGTTYLTPDENPLQGDIALPRACEVADVVEGARVVVITGGNLNDWTRSVAEEGFKQGKPVIYIELAYTFNLLDGKGKLSDSLNLIIAGSEQSAKGLQKYFNADNNTVKVLGYPNNDNISEKIGIKPQKDNVILFLTNTETSSEGKNDLKNAATFAYVEEFDIMVRRHPRDNDKWKNMPYAKDVTDLNLIDVLTECKYVVGSPGTTYFNATILQKPVITFKSTIMDMIPEEIINLSYQVDNMSDFINLLNSSPEVKEKDNEYVTGPVDNIVEKIDLAFKEVLKR